MQLCRRPVADVRSIRSGSTLTEVLVALMIMSIGLVSLATLFPLATLRAVKASQLTHATDLRYNAETLLEMYPKLISDPDLDNNVNTLNLPIDYTNNNGALGRPGNSLATVPIAPYRLWVIDPVGWIAADEPSLRNNVNFRDSFGQDLQGNPWTHVQRFPFGRINSGLADAFAGQPDAYSTLFEGKVTSLNSVPASVVGATQAVVPGSGAQSLPLGSRLVLLGVDGKSIQTRILTKIDATANTLWWTEDLNTNDSLDNGEDFNGNGGLDHSPLPLTFQPLTLRVEIPERRYSWLLTVRRGSSGLAEVDVVVFFSRSLSIDPADPRGDEKVYPVRGYNPTTRAIDTNRGFFAGSAYVNVDYSGAPGAAKPAFKKGGWIFDAGNARWYRIVDVTDNPSANNAVIRFDPPATVSSPRDNNGNPLGNRAMFPRGVVDVFSLGTKP